MKWIHLRAAINELTNNGKCNDIVIRLPLLKYSAIRYGLFKPHLSEVYFKIIEDI